MAEVKLIESPLLFFLQKKQNKVSSKNNLKKTNEQKMLLYLLLFIVSLKCLSLFTIAITLPFLFYCFCTSRVYIALPPWGPRKREKLLLGFSPASHNKKIKIKKTLRKVFIVQKVSKNVLKLSRLIKNKFWNL